MHRSMPAPPLKVLRAESTVPIQVLCTAKTEGSSRLKTPQVLKI